MARKRVFSGEILRDLWATLKPILKETLESLSEAWLRQLIAGLSGTQRMAATGDGLAAKTIELTPDQTEKIHEVLAEFAAEIAQRKIGIFNREDSQDQQPSLPGLSDTASGGEKPQASGGAAQSASSPTVSSEVLPQKEVSPPTQTKPSTSLNGSQPTAVVQAAGTTAGSKPAATTAPARKGPPDATRR